MSLDRPRGSSPIAVLMDRNSITIEERDIRVEDYLCDKLQTTSDFANLDSLLASVEIQHVQLLEQLQKAETKLAAARKASDEHTTLVLKQTQEFERQQKSIDNTLTILSNSDAPDEAVLKLRRPLEKIRRLELAQSYLELLKDVDTLTVKARQCLPERPKEALLPYTRLKELAITLRTHQGPADDAASHLIDYVDNTSKQLWDQMKKIMMDEFTSVQNASKWPDCDEEWSQKYIDCFERLLDLQYPELTSAKKPVVLLPMAVMARPHIQEFKYHFMQARPTNNKRKPEFFFKWIIDRVSQHEQFLQIEVGPVLAEHFRGSKLAENSLYIDPVSAFITALLPAVQEKTTDLLTVIGNDPALLHHFVNEVQTFDDEIRSTFRYDAGDSNAGWPGLTAEVMADWFQQWLIIEKTFALERFQTILDSSNNGQIDYDSTGPGKTKPTYGAEAVEELLTSTTKLYKRLRKFQYKLRFLIDIQVSIVDLYHNRLRDSLDAYQSITSAVGRTIHGYSADQHQALQGTGGLESLCKVYGSADFLISLLHDWSNDLFFVDLWNELQERARSRDVSSNLAGPMSYSDVKGRTSASVGSADEGALFDETIRALRRLRDRAEILMVESIMYAFPATLKAYRDKPQWTTVDDSTDDGVSHPALTITAELDQPLQTLKANMAFLHRALGTAAFRRVWSACFDSLQDYLWNEVLIRESFTTIGAAQFLRDLTAIWGIIDIYVTDGSSTALGMPRLKEGVQLLNLPIKVQRGDAMTLEAAYNRLFTSNEEGKKVLEELRFASITHLEARQVLQRRVECGE